MFTVRRHLGKGAQFMHYQIRLQKSARTQGDIVEHVNPDTHSIIFKGCELFNNEKLSAKILDGTQKKKKPCAWIICESYEVVEKLSVDQDDVQLKFNPRVSARWEIDGIGSVDGERFDEIVMKDARVYIK
jgi:hypothetical protein